MGIDPGSMLGKIGAAIMGAILNFLSMEKTKVEAEKAESLKAQLASIKEADERAKKERAVLHAALLKPEVSDDDWNTGGGHEEDSMA